MLTLNNLKPAGKKRKRVGRGGSRGGTSGKGHKGQKARSGGAPAVGFEGGQMPLYRRLPKRGFTNARFKQEFEILNLDRLNDLFEDGAVVNKETVVEKNIVKGNKSLKGKIRFNLKVLGDGKLIKKLIVHADAFSKSAIKAIEESGGKAVLIEEK